MSTKNRPELGIAQCEIRLPLQNLQALEKVLEKQLFVVGLCGCEPSTDSGVELRIAKLELFD